MKKVVIIGCGNVAWHMASHLTTLKKYELSVFNHQPNPLLKDFKRVLRLAVGSSLDDLPGNADIYVISVSDKAIIEVARHLAMLKPRGLVVHTSGSASLEDLGKKIDHAGVLYPLQSFSRTDTINWQQVPLIIESKNARSRSALRAFASDLSGKILLRSAEERLRLHLSAVLVNNFTNAMFVAADLILSEEGAEEEFKYLLPLIHKTTEKLSVLHPADAQTGPARRKDKSVMKKHLSLLGSRKDLKRIYKLMSRLIVAQQKHYAQL